MKRIIYLAAIIFLASCGKKEDKKAELTRLKKERAELDSRIAQLEAETGSSDSKKTVDVSLLEAEEGVFRNYVEVQGRVDAEENVQVNPEAQGVVTAIYVRIGQNVRKGQVLAQIDDKVLRQNMAQLQTQLDLANTLFKRQQNLWEQKIGTEVQYLNAKTQKENLEKQMGVLRSQLDMYKIKSPINGTIDQMDLKIGQAVMPGNSGIRVVNASNLKVKAFVADTYAGKVTQGDDVKIIFPDIPDSLSTHLTFVSKTIDPAARSFSIEVKLPSSGRYRPNMLAVLKIVDYINKNAITVPVNAIQRGEDSEYVYIAENGRAKRVNIKTGKVYDGQAEVISGLKAGDKIITAGFQDLNNGDSVRI